MAVVGDTGRPNPDAGPPDETLASLAASGERACFEKLIARHKDRVYRICYRSAGNAADADDWAQECFLRAYQHLALYDGARPFAPWFYRLVANVCTNMARGRSRARAGLEPAPESGLGAPEASADGLARDPAAVVLSGEVRRQVLLAIGELRPPVREAVLLRVLEEMSFRDLAEAFGVPVSTASTWVRRALDHVRKRLILEGLEVGPW